MTQPVPSELIRRVRAAILAEQAVQLGTAPRPSGHLGDLDPAAALAILNGHAEEALKLEREAALAVAGPVHAAHRELMTWTAQQWVRRFGNLRARIDLDQWTKLRPAVARQLADAEPTITRDAVLGHARAALDLGVQQGALDLRVIAPPVRRLTGAIEGYGLVAEAAIGARYQASLGLLNTRPVRSHPQLLTALAPTKTAGSDVERITRTAVNAAVNQGLTEVATEHEASILWVAERDGCVVCLALSGDVVGAGEDFDTNATFGEHPIEWWTPEDHDGPLRAPRHPHCRCRCEPWLGGSDLPGSLKREAQRSILRGWRLPGESEGARIRAAKTLLARGSTLPRSVQDRARNAVAAGHFKQTSRLDVPQETK